MKNRPTVIIVESDENFLVYLSTLLDRMNFEVLPIKSSDEAYGLAKIVKPDLFFLEASKEEESGLKILQRIRKDNLLTKTPVIMVGNEETGSEKFFAAGCSDFITKPVGLALLHVSLQKCLPNREGMRKYLRAPFNQKVMFEFAGLDINCFAVTLSEGGVYLRTNKPLPVNSKVKVRIPLASGEISIGGRVIYTMGLVRGPFLIPPGMAIQFDEHGHDTPETRALSNEICHLLVGDIMDEQDESVFKCGNGSKG